jgi:hypothetical protein
MTEEERAGVDWERFVADKLYRALVTERGLPPLPAGYRIDVPRLRWDEAYNAMLDTRGFTRTPEDEEDSRQMLAEQLKRRRGSTYDVYEEGPPKVVCISDPRFRVKRPPALSAPQR